MYISTPKDVLRKASTNYQSCSHRSLLRICCVTSSLASEISPQALSSESPPLTITPRAMVLLSPLHPSCRCCHAITSWSRTHSCCHRHHVAVAVAVVMLLPQLPPWGSYEFWDDVWVVRMSSWPHIKRQRYRRGGSIEYIHSPSGGPHQGRGHQ